MYYQKVIDKKVLAVAKELFKPDAKAIARAAEKVRETERLFQRH